MPAVLVFAADISKVTKNNIRGNSDVGILVVANGGQYDNNKIFDLGPDHPNSCCDVGLWDTGTGNTVTGNKVRGFDDPYLGVAPGGNNKVIPGPQIYK